VSTGYALEEMKPMVMRSLVFREDGDIRLISKKISEALWDRQSSLPELAGRRVLLATQ
jgi:hypothetical protein